MELRPNTLPAKCYPKHCYSSQEQFDKPIERITSQLLIRQNCEKWSMKVEAAILRKSLRVILTLNLKKKHKKDERYPMLMHQKRGNTTNVLRACYAI